MKHSAHSAIASVYDRLAHLALRQPPQRVLGLQVGCPLRFRPNGERARMVRANLDPEIGAHLCGLEVFDTPGWDLITDIGVSRYAFHQCMPLSLECIAAGSAEHLSRLDGVKRPKLRVRALEISGLHARWISFAADRWESRVGVEELAIFDPRSHAFWTAQVAYSQRPPRRMLSGLSLYRARAAARKILASIRLSSAR